MSPDGRVLLAVLLAAGAPACAPQEIEATQIVVQVSSDLAVPSEIDTVKLVISGKTSTVTHTVLVSSTPMMGRNTLPFTFTLVPDGASDAEFTIDATALIGTQAAVSQKVTTSFTAGAARLLGITLNRACVRVMCSASMTCSSGACVNQQKPAADLPSFVPPAADGPKGDAGDAGARDSQSESKPPQYFLQTFNNDLDIVFMVDNSSSMEQEQASLSRNFPIFINVLKSMPMGLPDVHIGVVSSALGAGAFNDVPGCPTNGDRGAFQNAPRALGGSCTTVPRDAYIISLQRGSMNNFPAGADIADVFKCIAELGTGGCGFEHQLAAVRRALGGDPKAPAPGENNMFLRPDALLAVVLLTDVDDCSAPADSDLFDPKQSSVSDPLGPLSSYRCNEFGHLCGGARPPRTAAMNLPNCHSAEDAGKLIKVAEFVSFFKTLKSRPGQVLVSAVAGPPQPYSVGLNGQQQPEITPSCTSMNGAAFPAVRIKELTDAMGTDGSFTSICQDNLAISMDAAAKRIARKLGTQCLEGYLVDRSPAIPGLQADCEVFDQTGASMNALPACDVAAPPCWRLVQNETDCSTSRHEIQVDRGGVAPPPGAVLCARCETCGDPSDPRCAP